MNTAAIVSLLNALNTLLQFARDNGLSSRKLLDEYLAARAENRELTQADIASAKLEARKALEDLNAVLSL